MNLSEDFEEGPEKKKLREEEPEPNPITDTTWETVFNERFAWGHSIESIARSHGLTEQAIKSFCDNLEGVTPLSQTLNNMKDHDIGVLDDYANIALDYLTPSPLKIQSYTAPLQPFDPAQPGTYLESYLDTLRKHTILVAMRERTAFPRALLDHLPRLKIIFGTGGNFTSWDLDAMKEKRIAVYAAPGKGRTDGTSRFPKRLPGAKQKAHPTTQHIWALILALARNVAADDAAVKTGAWQSSMAVGLEGKTLGLVGLGRLGAAVARIAVLAFGMRVVCWSSNLMQERADAMARAGGLEAEVGGGEKTFRVVEKRELFETADVVSLHYVLSERSRGIVGRDEFAVMKESAFFVNTARGPLVDEQALLETLREGKIAGAALDVFDVEPLPADSPWRSEEWGKGGTSRVLLTPHMGYVEEEVLGTWYEEIAENLERLVKRQELLHRIV